jgi:undecaprenyl-diphosphatase
LSRGGGQPAVAQCAIFLSIVIAVGVWLRLPRHQKWEFAFTGVIGGAIGVALLTLGSALYYDPRPFVTQHVTPLFPHAADNGFPSDHTLLAMFLAMCALFYSRKWGVLIALATAIGVARVASHVHHRIDIVGAMVVAIVAALGRDGPLCG